MAGIASTTAVIQDSKWVLVAVTVLIMVGFNFRQTHISQFVKYPDPISGVKPGTINESWRGMGDELDSDISLLKLG